MKRFNVLDRNLHLHQHYLLEASAGTGKTFSIQNIFVRLLLEAKDAEEPLTIEKILIVTFTRAATRDLKVRIRANLTEALNFLENGLADPNIPLSSMDYLNAYLEKDQDSILKAIKILRHALFNFAHAQVFTIHSFCARMLRQFALESDTGFHYFSSEDPLPYTELMEIIKDFFRSEVRIDQFSPAQLDILLRGDPDQKKLLRIIQTGHTFPKYDSFRDIYKRFSQEMLHLREVYGLEAEKMVADFEIQANLFKNYKIGISKNEVLEKIYFFANLFEKDDWSIEDLDQLIYDSLVWVKALDPSLYKGKGLEKCDLFYPNLTEKIKNKLYGILEEAGDFSILLLRMAHHCQRYLHRYQYEEDKLGPDDILRKMQWALDQSTFLPQIQTNYRATIIDEFQDTDPIQWNIFSRLFLSDDYPWTGYLYLVGDPKQSIYSFRQADIYTYLSAAQILGEEHCYSLDVNFRSDPALITALNQLFSIEHLPNFIPLPKKSIYLNYQPVRAPEKKEKDYFKDEMGAVHFFVADGQAFKKPKLSDLETAVFFPYIVEQILRLKKQKNFQFSQFAVLIRDRHQGQRLAQFLDQFNIPYLNQRGSSLIDTDAYQSLIDLLHAVLKPHDRGIVRIALGGPILGWTHEEILSLENMDQILMMIQRFRFILFEKGFSSFIQKVLSTPSKEKELTIQEHLLSRENGIEFLRNFLQIVDLVISHQYEHWNSPEGIISFLDHFHVWEQNDDIRVKKFQDPHVDGVKILTLHLSKGLEFDIVFALGLVNRTSILEDFYAAESENKTILTPLSPKSSMYAKVCEENDAEKMRQLYVALTRAKYQLYIPVALHMVSDQIEMGEASPMDLFLARLNDLPAEYDELYERIKTFSGKNFIDFLDEIGHTHSISYSIHQKVTIESSMIDSAQEEKTLYAPPSISLNYDSLWMTSFSHLSQLTNQASSEKSLDALVPRDFSCLNKTVHTLPSNSETGLLIHYILEKVNFKEWKTISKEHSSSILRSFISKTSYKDWEETLFELLFNILKTQLFIKDEENFCLADLKHSDHYKEMPFLYPFDVKEEKNFLEELNLQKGMIKGVLDLLFCYKNKYYLIDWKTNWLGSSAEDYHAQGMQKAMQDHAYFLQASIYKEAMKRYLKLVEKRSFEECFGGIYYLFVRGMEGGKQTGIFRVE